LLWHGIPFLYVAVDIATPYQPDYLRPCRNKIGVAVREYPVHALFFPMHFPLDYSCFSFPFGVAAPSSSSLWFTPPRAAKKMLRNSASMSPPIPIPLSYRPLSPPTIMVFSNHQAGFYSSFFDFLTLPLSYPEPFFSPLFFLHIGLSSLLGARPLIFVKTLCLGFTDIRHSCRLPPRRPPLHSLLHTVATYYRPHTAARDPRSTISPLSF